VLPGAYTVTLDYGGTQTRASFNVGLDLAFTSNPARSPRDSRCEPAHPRGVDTLDRRVNEALAMRSRRGTKRRARSAIGDVRQFRSARVSGTCSNAD